MATVKHCSWHSIPGCYSNIFRLQEEKRQPAWKKHNVRTSDKICPHCLLCQVTGIPLRTWLCDWQRVEKRTLHPHHCAFNSVTETRPGIWCQECTFPAGAQTVELRRVVLAHQPQQGSRLPASKHSLWDVCFQNPALLVPAVLGSCLCPGKRTKDDKTSINFSLPNTRQGKDSIRSVTQLQAQPKPPAKIPISQHLLLTQSGKIPSSPKQLHVTFKQDKTMPQ